MTMRVWKNSPLDSILVAYSVVHLLAMFWFAAAWDSAATGQRAAMAVGTCFLITYNIIVVTHLFTHQPWFVSGRLNALVSLINSINVGQSVQAYQLTHVRNHHRFNNDVKGPDGSTRDLSSTYRDGKAGEHAPLISYAVGGAVSSLVGRAREVLAGAWLWRVRRTETTIMSLVAHREPRQGRELRQVQLDRAAHCLSLVAFATLSWRWALFGYLPAFFLALILVNIQNYYRHYGADPHDRAADSVSHYGRLYNLLAFNDGYHQEHHLSPTTHWSRLPAVREKARNRLDATTRIVSPVPAMVGFLDVRRALLHRSAGVGGDAAASGPRRSGSR
ncbi:fatty acid desaturase family protein [Micromonospora sp. SCSIO 07396]